MTMSPTIIIISLLQRTSYRIVTFDSRSYLRDLCCTTLSATVALSALLSRACSSFLRPQSN